MPDYNEIAQSAADALAEYGSPAVLTRRVIGDYDPSVGEPDDDGSQAFNTVALRADYRKSDIDGTLIKAGDVRLYVSPLLATEPKPGDVITFDGDDWLVVNASQIKPASIVVLHDLQCRNA